MNTMMTNTFITKKLGASIITYTFVFGLMCSFNTAVLAKPAQKWIPKLQAPKGGYRTPDGEFRIKVPKNLSNKFLGQLALEMDGIDVTSLIQRKNDYAILKLPEQLSYGKHVLRIVHMTDEGDIEELAYWQIEIRQTSLFREASFAADMDINHTQRLKPEQGEERSDRTEGSMGLNVNLADGNWQTNMNANIIGNSDEAQLQSGEKYDLAEFLFTNKTSNTTTQLGHHGINHSSMVLDQFGNRGGSFQYSSDDARYNTTAFSMYRNPVSGFQGGMGVATARSSIDGLNVTAHPVKSDPGKVYLSMIYLEGKDQDLSNSASGYSEGIPPEGKAWSLQAESQLFSKRLRLGMEYAGTSVSAKTETITEGEFSYETEAYSRSDNAYALFMVLNSGDPDPNSETPAQWQLGLERRVVGTDFQSIANPGMPFDRRSWRLFGELNRGGFALQTSLGTEMDNVDEAIELPTVRKNIYKLTTSYSPPLDYDKKGEPVYGLLGQQAYNVSYTKELRKKVKEGVDSLAAPLDEETDSVAVGGGFTYPRWGWNLAYNTSYYRDLTNQNTDTIIRGSNLDVTFPIGERVSVRQGLQRNETYMCDTGHKLVEKLANLELSVEFMPSKLNASINYTLNDTLASDDSQNSRTETMATNLAWVVRESRENSPGINVQLTGSRNRVKDRLEDTVIDSTQIFLGLSVAFPARY